MTHTLTNTHWHRPLLCLSLSLSLSCVLLFSEYDTTFRNDCLPQGSQLPISHVFLHFSVTIFGAICSFPWSNARHWIYTFVVYFGSSFLYHYLLLGGHFLGLDYVEAGGISPQLFVPWFGLPSRFICAKSFESRPLVSLLAAIDSQSALICLLPCIASCCFDLLVDGTDTFGCYLGAWYVCQAVICDWIDFMLWEYSSVYPPPC